MSKKIATPESVIRACTQLEESGKPWNRDDVRYHVGGGSFSIIDPLIVTWKSLRPVFKACPTTPESLILEIASGVEETLNGIIHQYDTQKNAIMGEFESRVTEFSETVTSQETKLDDLACKNRGLNNELDKQKGRLENMAGLKAAVDNNLEHITAERDKLAGKLDRLQTETQQLAVSHKEELRLMETKYEYEFSGLKQQHEVNLERQAKELQSANERSENHLMRLIDQERTTLKSVKNDLTKSIKNAESLKLGNVKFCEERKSDRLKIVELNSTLIDLTQSKQCIDEQLRETQLALKELEIRHANLHEEKKSALEDSTLKALIKILEDKEPA